MLENMTELKKRDLTVRWDFWHIICNGDIFFRNRFFRSQYIDCVF